MRRNCIKGFLMTLRICLNKNKHDNQKEADHGSTQYTIHDRLWGMFTPLSQHK